MMSSLFCYCLLFLVISSVSGTSVAEQSDNELSENKQNTAVTLSKKGHGALFGLSSAGLATSVGVMVGAVAIILGVVMLLPVILGTLELSTALGTSYNSPKLSRSGDAGVPSLPYQLYKSLDKYLQDSGTDPSACLQKVVCSTVQSSARNMRDGRASTMDRMVIMASGSPSVLTYVGIPENMKNAARIGSSSDKDCDQEIPKCPFSWTKIMTMLYTPISSIPASQ